MKLTIAYLARDKLHLKVGDAPVRTIESQFGKTIMDREMRSHQRHAWKQEGQGFLSGGLLWGRPRQPDPTVMPIAITSVARGYQDREWFYTLETDRIGGLLALRNQANDELRISHRADRRLRYLSTHPTEDRLACAVMHADGRASLAVMKTDGTDFQEVTEGDSVDLAPAWRPDQPRELVYQSAGIGRDRNGYPAGQAPYSIHRLSLEGGEMECLVEDPRHDLLNPKVAANGDLYYIQRPYRSPHSSSPLRLLLDIVLFPVRLLHVIFQWLNFFSVRYTGKPLASSGDVKQQEMDMRKMMIWGNLIDARDAMRKGRKLDPEAPDLVPRSWQLIRQSPDGETEVVARGVLAYDIAPDGSIVYSNGSAIHLIDSGGARARILVDRFIEQVVAA